MNGGAPSPEAGSGSSRRVVLAGLILILLAGVLFRIKVFGQSLVGDELSTLWIVEGRSAGEVIDLVRSDAEISPPLFFLLAWAAEKLWSAPEAIRLPSLLAGLGFLPMIGLVARELFDRRVAVVTVSLASLAPILVYFSANGRGYAVMLFFLAASTWAMLRAARSTRVGWWVLYALCAATAMYAHYTGVFVLVGQFAWLLFAVPGARVRATVASFGAALLYLPWIGGLRADADSPTTSLLEAIQGQGFEAKRIAIEQLLFWEIQGGEWSLAGRVDVWLIAAGIAVCAAGVVLAIRRGKVHLRPDAALVLVLVLVFASPVGSLLAGIVGTDTFGGRNLAASWTGLPVLFAAGAVAAGRRVGMAAVALVLAGLLIGSVHLADPGRTEFRYADAAGYIDRRAEAGDAVVDNSHVTPVPLTPLGAYLEESDLPQYRLNLQSGDPPFLPGGPIPDPGGQLRQAFSSQGKVFVVTLIGADRLRRGRLSSGGEVLPIPDGWRLVVQESFDGIYPITVSVFERSPGERQQ